MHLNYQECPIHICNMVGILLVVFSKRSDPEQNQNRGPPQHRKPIIGIWPAIEIIYLY